MLVVYTSYVTDQPLSCVSRLYVIGSGKQKKEHKKKTQNTRIALERSSGFRIDETLMHVAAKHRD